MAKLKVHLFRIFYTIYRLITFQLDRDGYLKFDHQHLIIGLLCTWIVGIGRNLHNNRVPLLVHLGVGSVIYIFLLSILFWLVVKPLKVKNFTYLHLLTFISLVSPTGLIYAIPVENFMPFGPAALTRLCFVGIVSIWRVALWFNYLAVFCRVGPVSSTITSAVPLMIIVATLTILNLDRVVLHFMEGNPNPSSDDGPYLILLLLTGLSIYGIIPFSISYIFVVIHRRQNQ